MEPSTQTRTLSYWYIRIAAQPALIVAVRRVFLVEVKNELNDSKGFWRAVTPVLSFTSGQDNVVNKWVIL